SETYGSCSLSAASCELSGQASAVRAKNRATQAEEAQRGLLQHRRRSHAFRRRLGARAESRPPRRRMRGAGEEFGSDRGGNLLTLFLTTWGPKCRRFSAATGRNRLSGLLTQLVAGYSYIII